MVEIFRAGSTNGVVKRAPRRPSSIASAIGRGLGGFGATLDNMADNTRRTDQAIEDSEFRVERIEQERDRSRRAVEFGAKLAEARRSYARDVDEARGKTAPGAPEWEETAAQLREKHFGTVLDDYSDDPDLQATLAPSLNSVTQGIADRELNWSLERKSEWEGEAYSIAEQTEADALIDDPGALGEALARQEILLEATDFDGTTKEKVRNATRAKLLNSALEGLEQQGAWDQIEALLGDEALNGALGKSKALWLDRIEAGREAQRRSSQVAMKEAQGAVLNDMATVEALIDAGEDVPAAQFAQIIDNARLAGVDEADIIEFAALGRDSAHASHARKLTTGQIETRLGLLQEQINAGSANGSDLAQFKVLENELERRDDTVADGLTGLKSDNIAEQAAAMDQLAGMSVERRVSVAERAGDTGAALLAALPQRNRQIALQGRQVRANNPDAYMPPNGKGESDKGRLDDEFRRVLGPRLTAQLVQTNVYEAAREAATDYFVGNQVRQGGGGKWGREAFARSVAIIFGARQRADGAYAGGLGHVRGRMVQLPDRYTSAEFDQAYSQLSFAGASYADGSPASKDDVLANFTPIYVGTIKGASYYQLQDANGNRLIAAGSQEPYHFQMGAR